MWRRMVSEISLSFLGNAMPRTPIEVRPWNTLTSVTAKRMHWPPAAVSSTSSRSVQICTSTIASSSSSFMAMMPERRTSTKSDSLLRRTLPPVVANITSRSAHEDSSSWADLDVMFATTGGNVRRNKLSDFVDVRRSGIIAMKLDADEAIVDVQICTEHDDVLLTAAGGQCIRFAVTDVRVFQGRTSMGVRGIALPKDDKLISLTILRHMDADAEERAAYLRRAN